MKLTWIDVFSLVLVCTTLFPMYTRVPLLVLLCTCSLHWITGRSPTVTTCLQLVYGEAEPLQYIVTAYYNNIANKLLASYIMLYGK